MKTTKTTSKMTKTFSLGVTPKGKNSKSLRTLLAVKETEDEGKKAFLEAVKEQKAQQPVSIAKTQEKATEAQEKATPKSTGIINGGLTKCNEQVGIHYSIAKTWLDDKKPTPEIGDLVMVQVGESEIPLIARTVQPKVNGDLFVQAFLVEKGSGHHEILGKAKDTMVKVFWA